MPAAPDTVDLEILRYRPGRDDAPRISYGPVTITRSPPGTRAYGAAGEAAEAEAEHLIRQEAIDAHGA